METKKVEVIKLFPLNIIHIFGSKIFRLNIRAQTLMLICALEDKKMIKHQILTARSNSMKLTIFCNFTFFGFIGWMPEIKELQSVLNESSQFSSFI
jgi:hypothetical protein